MCRLNKARCAGVEFSESSPACMGCEQRVEANRFFTKRTFTKSKLSRQERKELQWLHTFGAETKWLKLGA